MTKKLSGSYQSIFYRLKTKKKRCSKNSSNKMENETRQTKGKRKTHRGAERRRPIREDRGNHTPFGPAVAGLAVAAAVHARDTVTAGALVNHPFPKRERQGKRRSQSAELWDTRRALRTSRKQWSLNEEQKNILTVLWAPNREWTTAGWRQWTPSENRQEETAHWHSDRHTDRTWYCKHGS